MLFQGEIPAWSWDNRGRGASERPAKGRRHHNSSGPGGSNRHACQRLANAAAIEGTPSQGWAQIIQSSLYV